MMQSRLGQQHRVQLGYTSEGSHQAGGIRPGEGEGGGGLRDDMKLGQYQPQHMLAHLNSCTIMGCGGHVVCVRCSTLLAVHKIKAIKET